MKLYKNLLLGFVLLISLKAKGMEGGDQGLRLLDLPSEIVSHVSFYLTEEENGIFRQTSQCIKEAVDESYRLRLKKNFNKFSKDDFPAIPTSNLKYLNHIMRATCTSFIKENGFLFVPQGNLLEAYLSKHYRFISIHPFLKNEEKDWTKNLFKTLFGKKIPEGQFDQSLNLLTACLPVNHIYSDKAEEAPLSFKEVEDSMSLLKNFMKRNGIALLDSLKKMNESQRYFLVGIDTDASILNEGAHLIVVNQSHAQDLKKLESYLSGGLHTIVYNADQEILSFLDPPKNLVNLILTDGSNQCASIRDEFLSNCTGLRSLNTQGLINVTSIGNYFLHSCLGLTSFDTKGLINITSIGTSFLYSCTCLTSLDTQWLINVTSIGDFFLAACTGLTSFDTQGLINVTSIGNYFLSYCKGLKSCDTRGLTNLTSIGNNFLSSCTGFTSLDTQGLINVTSIGHSFLQRSALSSQAEELKKQIFERNNKVAFCRNHEHTQPLDE